MNLAEVVLDNHLNGGWSEKCLENIKKIDKNIKIIVTTAHVLNLIHDNQDSQLSYAYCCRNRHCGICGIMVNNTPVLACKCAAEPELTLAPLKNFSVLKDLGIDRDAYEKHRERLRLFWEREGEPVAEPETIDMERFEAFKTASRCIECFCCVAACPVYAKRPHAFLGPAGNIRRMT